MTMRAGPKVIHDAPIEQVVEAPLAQQERPIGGGDDAGSSHLIRGPSQATAQGDAIKVRAAVEHAIGAMDGARTAMRRGIHPSVVPAIGQLADSFRAAITALARGDSAGGVRPEPAHARSKGLEEERNRLFDALGAILGPLEELVAKVSAEGAPKKARDLKDALAAAYRDLLTPTEPHFWPEAESVNVGPAGNFLPTRSAVEIAKRAFDRFEAIVKTLPQPLSQQAEIALYSAILSSEQIGGLMSIDAGVLDFLPQHIAKAITRDHHGIHSDPDRPQVNSTMKMLDDVERVRAMTGLTVGEKIARLQNQYAYMTTDNLGDAIIPLVLARRLPELVRDGGITIDMKMGTKVQISIGQIRRMSHFEDFGFFGSAKMTEGRRKSAPGEVVLRDLIHLILANFHSFDQILREHGLFASDRFDSLPDLQQAQLVEQAIAKVEENLDDYGARLSRANDFKAEVSRLKEEVYEAHQAMQEYLVGKGVSPEDREILDRSIFYFFDTAKGGRFATWDAPALIHNRAIQWQSIRFPPKEGEPESWGFVLAVPSGRDPHFLDTTMAKAFGPQLPKAIVRGDTLLFVFNPKDGELLPEKMAEILAKELRAHFEPSPAPDNNSPPPSCGENIISHDAYIYDDDGRYIWTADRLREAESNARLAFIEALEQPWCKRAVLMVGTAGSGKTTYLNKNFQHDTVYYDSTLATPERRKVLIDEAKKRGIPIEVVWTDTPLDECLARNAQRPEDRRVPEHILAANHDCLSRQPPSTDEGVERVTVVRSGA